MEGPMLSLIVTIAIVGLIVYLITTLVPMPPPFKTIIYVIACLWLLMLVIQTFGLDIPLHIRR
jgi:hypothetical protein